MNLRTKAAVVALVCAPVIAGIVKWKGREIDAAYENWRYPAPQGPAVTSLGEEILRQKDSDDMNRYLREYNRIEELVAAAQRRGVDVGDFVGRLKYSTILARQGSFREAMTILNLVEMTVPKPPQKIQPVESNADFGQESSGPIEGRPVRPGR